MRTYKIPMGTTFFSCLPDDSAEKIASGGVKHTASNRSQDTTFCRRLDRSTTTGESQGGGNQDNRDGYIIGDRRSHLEGAERSHGMTNQEGAFSLIAVIIL